MIMFMIINKADNSHYDYRFLNATCYLIFFSSFFSKYCLSSEMTDELFSHRTK